MYWKNVWLEYIAKNTAIENLPLLHVPQDENVFGKRRGKSSTKLHHSESSIGSCPHKMKMFTGKGRSKSSKKLRHSESSLCSIACKMKYLTGKGIARVA
jgi:hypothetical protein